MTDKMTDKIDLTSGENLFAATDLVADSAFATFDQPFRLVPTDETKEHEIKERVDNIAVESKTTADDEFKIATHEEILEAKGIVAAREVAKNYLQRLSDAVKNVSIVTATAFNPKRRISCVRIPQQDPLTVLDADILEYTAKIYGHVDYHEEKFIIGGGVSYKFYSFKTTVEEEYNEHLRIANAKRKLLDDTQNKVNEILRQKRRRLA